MRPVEHWSPVQAERDHAYRCLAILKVASPLVSALVAASATQQLAEEELDACVERLSKRAQDIAGRIAADRLQKVDAETRDRIQRQFAQDVAYLLAREHLRSRRNPAAHVTDATLAHILDLAQRHFEGVPGAGVQQRFERSLSREVELDLAWMRAVARLAEAAWTRPTAWSTEALADADPDALVERCGRHLAEAVERGVVAVFDVDRGEKPESEILAIVRLSLLGQLSRGYARILEIHAARERCAQTLEQTLSSYVEAVLRYARVHFAERPKTPTVLPSQSAQSHPLFTLGYFDDRAAEQMTADTGSQRVLAGTVVHGNTQVMSGESPTPFVVDSGTPASEPSGEPTMAIAPASIVTTLDGFQLSV